MRVSPYDLNLRPLYTFYHVAETGSFSRAAALLARDQPTLSKEIRQLEEHLGVDLFYRTGRGVSLTAEGELLARHVELILRTVVDTHTEMAALRETIDGGVIIAVPPMFGAALTGRLIDAVATHYPGVQLSFQEGFSTDMLAWLADGSVAVAVIYNAPNISTLNVEKLVEDRFHLVGRLEDIAALPAGEVTAETLATCPLVIAPKPHKLRMLVEEGVQKRKMALKIAHEVAGTSTTLELVGYGRGFTVLPERIVYSVRDMLKFDSRPLSGGFGRPKLYLVNSMHRPLTRTTPVVIDLIRNELRSNAASRRPARAEAVVDP